MDTKRPARPWSVLVGALVLVALIIVWVAQGILAGLGMPVGRAATIAVGMTLQVTPSLLLGVFVAELIEAFVSPALIARVSPMNPAVSVLTALVATFLLPVRNCSAVPIFRSLLRKSAPLSATTTLMLAFLAINPPVIASTHYAFGSWAIAGVRTGLSIIVTLSVGLSMLASPPSALRGEVRLHDGDSCGYDGSCKTPNCSFSGILGTTGHSFERILSYLLDGVTAPTAAQAPWPVSSLSAGLSAPGALVLMMVAGSASSLCSPSDAVIARSLASLAPQGVFMGFMVYGLMMDVRNVALLSSQFHGVFVLRLSATATCIVVVVIGGAWWMGALA